LFDRLWKWGGVKWWNAGGLLIVDDQTQEVSPYRVGLDEADAANVPPLAQENASDCALGHQFVRERSGDSEKSSEVGRTHPLNASRFPAVTGLREL
jgi:hypothetical protein